MQLGLHCARDGLVPPSWLDSLVTNVAKLQMQELVECPLETCIQLLKVYNCRINPCLTGARGSRARGRAASTATTSNIGEVFACACMCAGAWACVGVRVCMHS